MNTSEVEQRAAQMLTFLEACITSAKTHREEHRRPISLFRSLLDRRLILDLFPVLLCAISAFYSTFNLYLQDRLLFDLLLKHLETVTFSTI